MIELLKNVIELKMMEIKQCRLLRREDDLETPVVQIEKCRIQKKTDWTKYRTLLSRELEHISLLETIDVID